MNARVRIPSVTLAVGAILQASNGAAVTRYRGGPLIDFLSRGDGFGSEPNQPRGRDPGAPVRPTLFLLWGIAVAMVGVAWLLN
jgi:hypothetical protein